MAEQLALIDMPSGRPMRMRDGSVKHCAEFKDLDANWWYRKEDGLYWITHTGSGRLLTSTRTLKAAKALLAEPEFFDERLTLKRMFQAYKRYANRAGWRY